ncbi:MAG: hypothetical protein ACK5QX_00625 [bacterium]
MPISAAGTDQHGPRGHRRGAQKADRSVSATGGRWSGPLLNGPDRHTHARVVHAVHRRANFEHRPRPLGPVAVDVHAPHLPRSARVGRHQRRQHILPRHITDLPRRQRRRRIGRQHVAHNRHPVHGRSVSVFAPPPVPTGGGAASSPRRGCLRLCLCHSATAPLCHCATLHPPRVHPRRRASVWRS